MRCCNILEQHFKEVWTFEQQAVKEEQLVDTKIFADKKKELFLKNEDAGRKKTKSHLFVCTKDKESLYILYDMTEKNGLTKKPHALASADPSHL